MLDYNGDLMGPMNDEQGLEQGGKNSSEYYQLSLDQSSKLEVCMLGNTISSIGQADDTLLLSNDIFALYYLLILTLIFCQKYQVELSAEKTVLQVFAPRNYDCNALPNPIEVNGSKIPFSSETEHVGIIRNISGNLPSILARFSAHRKALAGVLHGGLARGHRANPMMSVRVEKLYATPVLLSGLGSLILSSKEINMIDHHYRETLRQLLRLHKNSPRCAVYFLAGSLPGIALVHLRQLNLFGMISRLNSTNLLHKHASNLLYSSNNLRGSWFKQILNLTHLYDLPQPRKIFNNPLKKEHFKSLVKKKVVSYWEIVLRNVAE